MDGSITNSQSLNKFSYVQGNPISLTDPFGLSPNISISGIGYAALDLLGIIPGFDFCDAINTAWYLSEGDYENAALSAVACIPLFGSVVGSGIKWGAKGVANAEKVADTVKLGSRIVGDGGAMLLSGGQAVESARQVYTNITNGEGLTWKNAVDVITLGISVAGMGMAGASIAKSGKSLSAMYKGETAVSNVATSNATKGVSKSVIYGTDDIGNYTYNMVENPGPLAEMQGNPAKNFYGGRYNVHVLTEDKIYYRGGNSKNPLGQWFTTEPPKSVAKVRIDTAVKPQWIDARTGELTGTSVVDTVYAIKIPKGTMVYTGPVGPQGGAYCGGYNMMQTFIKEPWKLNYEVISSSPLK